MPARRVAWILGGCLLALVIGFALYGLLSGGSKEPPRVDGGGGEDLQGEALRPGMTPKPGLLLQGSSFSIMSPDGNLEWQFEADSVEVSDREKRAKLHGVTGYYLEEGERVISVSSEEVEFLWERGEISFLGRVRVKRHAPGGSPVARFEADSARYEIKSRIFTARGNIHYLHLDTELSGDELTADIGLLQVVVRGNVRLKKGM